MPGSEGGIELAALDLADLATIREWGQRARDFGLPLDVLVNNAGVRRGCAVHWRRRRGIGGWPGPRARPCSARRVAPGKSCGGRCSPCAMHASGPAGVMACPQRLETKDGFEYQLGVNHVRPGRCGGRGRVACGRHGSHGHGGAAMQRAPAGARGARGGTFPASRPPHHPRPPRLPSWRRTPAAGPLPAHAVPAAAAEVRRAACARAAPRGAAQAGQPRRRSLRYIRSMACLAEGLATAPAVSAASQRAVAAVPTCRSTPERPSRIVNVSSAAHLFGRMNLKDLQSQQAYDAWRAYGQVRAGSGEGRQLCRRGELGGRARPGLACGRLACMPSTYMSKHTHTGSMHVSRHCDRIQLRRATLATCIPSWPSCLSAASEPGTAHRDDPLTEPPNRLASPLQPPQSKLADVLLSTISTDGGPCILTSKHQ